MISASFALTASSTSFKRSSWSFCTSFSVCFFSSSETCSVFLIRLIASVRACRTAGEYRLSNFLLWQLAYTELYVTPVLWPDVTRRDLFEAILDYQRRDRRFGKVPV